MSNSFRFEKPPVITEYIIQTEKLPEGEEHRFAVISDLHECSFGKDNDLLLSAIDSIHPEAVLIPGDLISAYPKADPRRTMHFLKRLHEKYPGIFFSPGNHERKLFERIKYTRQMMLFKKGILKAGVELRRNTRDKVGDNISVYSLDLNHDYYRRVIKKRVPSGMINCLLGKPDRRRFNILLAHDPDHFPEYAEWKPDLVLSGHVHGGLVRLPKLGGLISPAYRFFPKYDSGLYEKNGVKMIVSRGAGSHTFNIRINNPPEILKLIVRGGMTTDGKERQRQ